MKRVLIVGATSGLGYELAKTYIGEGCVVGVAGRRVERLEPLRQLAPERVYTARIDVAQSESCQALLTLVNNMGGMDIYVNAAGVGFQNPNMDIEKEKQSVEVNVSGFCNMVVTAFNYFKEVGGGQIVIISSVAGTRGLGTAVAYSSAKKMQSTYIQALNQLSKSRKYNISFTDIKPGFVETDFIKGRNYPLTMQVGPVVKAVHKAISKKKRVAVIDWKFSIIVFIWGLIPSFIWERIYMGDK